MTHYIGFSLTHSLCARRGWKFSSKHEDGKFWGLFHDADGNLKGRVVLERFEKDGGASPDCAPLDEVQKILGDAP